MLMEEEHTAVEAAGAAASGVKTTEPAVPSFCESHTPPPVVPRRTRLPVGSAGSMAMEEMRPVTRPKLGVITADGPKGCQTAVEALEELAVGSGDKALRGRFSAGTTRFADKPRRARKLRACLTLGGIELAASESVGDAALWPGAAWGNAATIASAIKVQATATDRWIDWPQVLLLAAIVTRKGSDFRLPH